MATTNMGVGRRHPLKKYTHLKITPTSKKTANLLSKSTPWVSSGPQSSFEKSLTLKEAGGA